MNPIFKNGVGVWGVRLQRTICYKKNFGFCIYQGKYVDGGGMEREMEGIKREIRRGTRGMMGEIHEGAS